MNNFSLRQYVAGAGCLVAALGVSNVSADTTIRFNDYDGNASFDPAYSFVPFAGAGSTTPVTGYAGIGVGGNVFSGNMFRNAAGLGNGGSGGAFSNLPQGGTLSFSFLFAAIDSWDGSNFGFGPDVLELLINDVSVWSTTLSNFPPSSSNGGTLLASGSFTQNPSWIDAAWDFTNVAGLINLAYSGKAVNYRLRASGAGWQGGNDESWAVDNFRVSLAAPVPEVGTYVLMLTGLFGLMLSHRAVQRTR